MSRDQSDEMINQHLLSRSISGVSLNFTAFVELEIPGWHTLVDLWHHNVTWYPIFISLDGRIDVWLNIFAFYWTRERQDSKCLINTAQKTKFSIKDFFSKFDQIRSILRIWSHLLMKSLMENFHFCSVKTRSRFTITFKDSAKSTKM